MLENLDIKKIFDILDAISSKLSEILIRGIENIGQGELDDIARLNSKFQKMNLEVASDLLNSFFEKIDHLKNGINDNKLKNSLASDILKVITSMKMFEIVLTTEIVKNGLKTVEE
ncbi:MAG: hypothetical protein JW891_09580 [Candidatus Lokiarchaeota archaeon]|nr:hypothetical protein [Candidatus Lokiarchaeota archaeon]